MASARDFVPGFVTRLAAPLVERIRNRKPRMGALARTSPFSPNFGFDLGTPVDRFYIEQFLAAHASDISGGVLEVGDSAYSDRFGSGIGRQDVLHVEAVPGATIVGDLAVPGSLPAEAFDCVVLTQTLHLIYDMAAAVAELHRALVPGGVALVTMPGVSSVARDEWGARWCWSLTGHSALRLFADAFGEANVDVEVHGNVYAATCFLHGLPLERVEKAWLEERDAAYPVIIAVRAVRSR